jgi:opacity protein-like surface antigen
MKGSPAGAWVLLLCVVATGQGQGLGLSRAGAHVGSSMGGDVEMAKAAFGAQTEFSIAPNISIELAASRFSDEYSSADATLDQDLTTVGLSALYRTPLAPELNGYALAGLDYNMAEIDAVVTPLNGIQMDADVDVDDAVGFHVGFGIDITVQDHVVLFAEYRYTMVEFDAEISASAMGYRYAESITPDYDFGLLKVGVNFLL